MFEVLRGLGLIVFAAIAGAAVGLTAVLFYGLLAGTVGWLFQYPVASWFGFTPVPWWVWVCGVVVVRVLLPMQKAESSKESAVGLAQPDRVTRMAPGGLSARW